MTSADMAFSPATLAADALEPSTTAEDGGRAIRWRDTTDREHIQPRAPLTGRHLAVMGGIGIVVLVLSVAVALYGIGPLVHDRDQRSLLLSEEDAIARAVRDNQGLYRGSLPTEPPLPGSPLGILLVPSLGVEQVVVEGVGPSQTVAGPGHVPGTAGLGQPGNSAIVARRSGYGGPFGRLADLKVGDHILTATTEGQSEYVIRSIRTVALLATKPTSATATPATTTTTLSTGTSPRKTSAGREAVAGSSAGPKPPATMKASTLYGPTADNQLTLVTSGSSVPWNSSSAVVVVARMTGQPFAPTPQESQSPDQQGTTGDSSALAWLLLSILALCAVALGSVAIYRRSTVRVAYVLTTAPLLAATVLTAEAATHLLPAWL